MQIKQELPQFTKNPALIISTGKQHALIYLASQGKIDKQAEIKIEADTYSDREGRFERRANHINLGSGSVYEDDNKENRINQFIKEIEKEIKKHQNIKTVHCFCPDYMKNYLKKLIKQYFSKTKIYLGNYTDEHPFVLLEKIKEV